MLSCVNSEPGAASALAALSALTSRKRLAKAPADDSSAESDTSTEEIRRKPVSQRSPGFETFMKSMLSDLRKGGFTSDGAQMSGLESLRRLSEAIVKTSGSRNGLSKEKNKTVSWFDIPVYYWIPVGLKSVVVFSSRFRSCSMQAMMAHS